MNQLIEILTWEPNVKMQYELVLMLLLFLLPAAFGRNRRQTALCWGFCFSLFLLLHRAFFALLVSGAYLYLLAGLCCMLYRLRPGAFLEPACYLKRELPIFLGFFPEAAGTEGSPAPSGGEVRDRGVLFLSAVILVLLLIQLCRINIAYDYDSLRYGLRSPYVLLGGEGLSGFLRNPGLVNTVYTYSKGFELLTLPLSFSGSYTYVLCANAWFLAGCIFLCGKMGGFLTGIRGAETLCGFFAALMPDITNMAVTAKSDLATLFFQMAFLYLVLRYLKDRGTERPACVGLGLAALFASYALKPTAMLFSSAAGLSVLCYLLYLRRREGKGEFPLLPSTGGLRLLILALLFTGLCWLRTALITGLPVTSVFSGVFSALGMELKYPFGLQALPDNAGALDFSESLRTFLSRLLRFLFCPLGEDMEHVMMAWGGLSFLLLLVLVCLLGAGTLGGLRQESLRNSVRKEELLPPEAVTEGGFRAARCLGIVFLATAGISLVSLWSLYQVDGNYYMLLYALTAVMGTCVLLYVGERLRRFSRVLLFLSAAMLYLTAFTGWAGPVGFTGLPEEGGLAVLLPVDHREEARKRHEAQGDEALWQALSQEGTGPANHVIAFSEEPGCYDIPCVVESYTDIAGSGGNVYLVKTLNIFKEYLDWSGTDYIYGDKEWLSRPGNERAKELLEDLIEDGTLTELCYSQEGSERDAYGASYEGRYFYGRIHPERVKEPWELPLSEEALSQAEREMERYVEE